MVGLESLIWVEADGERQQMAEWEARSLLHELGIPAPPVICADHLEFGKVVTSA